MRLCRAHALEGLAMTLLRTIDGRYVSIVRYTTWTQVCCVGHLAVTTGKSALSPFWLIIAGLDGALLVALGAAGAHGITPGGDAEGLFQTATQYQAWHALAIAMIGFAGGQAEAAAGRTVHAAGALFLAGTVLFCGSLYIRAFGGGGLFPMAAPIGGTLLILGWLAVAAIGGLEQIRVVRNRRRRSVDPKNLL